MAFREKEKEKKEDLLKAYKNVFDEGTMNSLWYLITHKNIEGLESPIKLGKESNVFSALTKDGKRLAVKIYRIISADFFTMSRYLGMDIRFSKPGRKKQIVLTWAKREFSNLLRAYKASVAVPMPVAIRENIVIMEFLGNQKEIPQPLPLMKDAVDDENAPRVYEKFIEEVRKLYRAGLVHGDLSEFNVLMDGEKPILIDLSHGITTLAPAASQLLDRDIDNIVRFFKKKGMKLDKLEVTNYIKG